MAISAARLGVRATIVVPQTAPQVKVDAVRAHGRPTVEVVLAGDSYSDAYAHAQTLARRQELTFIPAFDDPYVIAGQGTVGMEILRQMPSAPDVVFVPIGGGSLAAGVSTYVKAVNPAVRVVGVQTEDSCAMAQSLRAGERVNLAEVGLFSDGTAVKLVGENLPPVPRVPGRGDPGGHRCGLRRHQDVFLETRSVLEPAGAGAGGP